MEWTCCLSASGDERCCAVTDQEGSIPPLTLKRRLLEKCILCPTFRGDVARAVAAGSREGEIISLLAEEVMSQKAHLDSLASFLSTKSREIRFLHELGSALQTSMELDEVLAVGLTAITAGQGFGFNRAFLFLVDREQGLLRGHLGVGPRDYEEAWRIWSEIEQTGATLETMAHDLRRRKLASEREKFQWLLNSLSVPLSDEKHPFITLLTEAHPRLVENAYDDPVLRGIAETLGVGNFVIVPLISVYRRIGIIVADNFVTRQPITPQDLQSLETFAFPLSFAIERASLYEKVQEQVNKLTLANERLREQQELLLRMEKMALIGRITSSISHSIRNPLMIIGGFARSLLRTITDDDPKREYLELIVRETKQLENVLEEVLSYSDSLYPALDDWDINQLVHDVCAEMRPIVEEHGITLDLRAGEGIPLVHIDYKKIAYCVRTVIAHCTENVSGVTRITVETGREEDSVVILIQDDGVIVEETEAEHPSLPFSDTVQLGSGLGLPLCKTILERYGNHFQIETLPEGGTRYQMRIHQHREEE